MFLLQMLCSKDFYKKANYNHETCEQMWCSAIGDYHDTFCGCDQPFAHVLTCIFPIGHTDRNKTINQILERDYKQKCLGGGTGERDTTGAAFDPEEEKHTESPGDVPPTAEDLAFAAVADAAEEDIR